MTEAAPAREADVSSDVAARGLERIAIVYLIVAAVWIILSGILATEIAERTTISVTVLEVVKGLGFVVVTGAFLHHSLRRWSRRLQQATQAERDAAERMRRAEDMRRAFLTGVSHELRTPLTAIVGYGGTIQRDGRRMDGDLLEEVAGRLVVNAERLQAMIIDLLEVDRLLQGMGTLHRETTDVTELTRRVVRSTDTEPIRIELVGESLLAAVDGAKVERMLEHALHNSLRHSGEADAITVTVTGTEHQVQITVEDDGMGFPDALIGRLFDPFVQHVDAVDRPSPGLGIGLTLVAQFASLHGGSALAENRTDGGARLTMTLPTATV